SAAASAKPCERLANLSSLRLPIASAGSKSLTSAAMRTGKPDASNRLIAAPPLLQASSAAQVAATSLPTGVTSPRPVIATRDLAVQKQRCGKHRSPRKVIGKERRGPRHLKQCARRFVRADFECDELGRRDAAETAGRCTRRAQQAEPLAERLGRIELLHRQHR